MNETDILDEDGVLGEVSFTLRVNIFGVGACLCQAYITFQDELDYEEEVLKKMTGNDTSALELPGDVSVSSNNSSLNVTVIAASTEKALPPRGPRNQQKVRN